MRYFKTLVIILIVGFISSEVNAATTKYYSIINGTWTTSGTWSNISGGASCGCFPANNTTNGNDEIYIESTVTLNAPLTVKTGTILTIRTNDTLIVNGDTEFANGSIINIEPGGVLIVNGNLNNRNNSNTVTVDGTIVVNGNFTGGNGSQINGAGAMDVSGSAITSGSGTIFGSTYDCTVGPCNSSASAPLPIELIYFNAVQNENVIEITWVTASEINNDYFTIERSKDALEWEEVLSIKGAGNSTKTINYFEIDNNPKKGLMYYRIKQTDFNGNYTYSNITPVNFEKTGKDVVVYPNPNEGIFFNVDLSGYKNEQVIVVIRDVQGRQLYSKVFIVDDNQTTSISLEENLPKGTYLIIASSEDKLISKKLIVE